MWCSCQLAASLTLDRGRVLVHKTASRNGQLASFAAPQLVVSLSRQPAALDSSIDPQLIPSGLPLTGQHSCVK